MFAPLSAATLYSFISFPSSQLRSVFFLLLFSFLVLVLLRIHGDLWVNCRIFFFGLFLGEWNSVAVALALHHANAYFVSKMLLANGASHTHYTFHAMTQLFRNNKLMHLKIFSVSSQQSAHIFISGEKKTKIKIKTRWLAQTNENVREKYVQFSLIFVYCFAAHILPQAVCRFPLLALADV